MVETGKQAQKWVTLPCGVTLGNLLWAGNAVVGCGDGREELSDGVGSSRMELLGIHTGYMVLSDGAMQSKMYRRIKPRKFIIQRQCQEAGQTTR